MNEPSVGRPSPFDKKPQLPDSEHQPETSPAEAAEKKSHLRFYRVDRSKGPGQTELEAIPAEETEALLKSALAERERQRERRELP